MTGVSAAGILRWARWFASLFFFAVLTVACGGGDDGPAPPVQQLHQPSISNLRYSPTSVFQATGGTAAITGTFDFGDVGGDIASLRMTSSGGIDITTQTPELRGISGGTATGQVVVSVDKVGKYTFEIWVTDSMGTSSNRLSGSFEVLAQSQPPVEPADHVPGVVNLKYSPAFSHQSVGGTTTIAGSVDFVDTWADIAGVQVTGSWGANQFIATPGLNGVTSGSAAFEFAVPLGQAATLTFEVAVVDRKGGVSNRLVGSFEVLAVASADHVPTVRNLRYSPLSAFQNLSGTVAVTCTVDFADALGDIVSMRLVGSSGADATVTTPALNGVKSGTATVAFGVPVAQVGKLTFEVWAIDSKGSSSNRLSGTFEVLAPDTWITTSPPGVLNAIAFSNGRYMAVGPDGRVTTSLDLNTWAVLSVGNSVTLHGVAGSGSRFAAAGENGSGQALLITSTDGAVWSPVYQATAPSALFKVIWAGTQFVAVGQERGSDGKLYALILASPDGLSWTRSPQVIEVGDFGIHPRGMTSVAWSGSLYVAIGLNPDWEPAAWRSTDAMTWSSPVIIVDAIWAVTMSDISYGNGRFVGVNPVADFYGDAPVLLSTDGVSWRADAMPGNLPVMNAVTSGPAGHLAVGPDYRMTSADGLTWATTPMAGCGNGVVWDGARYVAVGQAVCKSP